MMLPEFFNLPVTTKLPPGMVCIECPCCGTEMQRNFRTAYDEFMVLCVCHAVFILRANGTLHEMTYHELQALYQGYFERD